MTRKCERETWYQWKCGFFGNLSIHAVATLVYLVLAFFPLYVWARGGYETEAVRDFAQSPLGVPWAFAMSIGYPLWSWCEIRAFERWVKTIPTDDRDGERAYFKLMVDCARSFWAAVLATYTIAGLWGIATK